jgi:hypothetical protein
MNPDRWKVVKGLFQRAIKLPPYDWSGYLDRVCAGDDDLREEVAALLTEHEPGAGPLLRPLASDDVTLRNLSLRSTDDTLEQSVAPEEPSDV